MAIEAGVKQTLETLEDERIENARLRRENAGLREELVNQRKRFEADAQKELGIRIPDVFPEEETLLIALSYRIAKRNNFETEFVVKGVGAIRGGVSSETFGLTKSLNPFHPAASLFDARGALNYVARLIIEDRFR